MKNPAVLLYTSDFITGTMFMTNEEVGAYIRVLCMQHQKGHLSSEEILKICKDEVILKSVLLHFKRDKNGLYYNERMDSEKEKRKKYSESRAKNRRTKTRKEDNISKTYEKHMENENENEDINEDYIINLYINTINPLMSSIELEKINYYMNVYRDDLRIIKYAIEYCKMYRVFNINYLCKILDNWNKSGYKTLEEIKNNENKKNYSFENKEAQKEVELFSYDWLNDEE